WDKGIIVVSACGNSGPEKSTIKSPSASKKIISVGALNDNRKKDGKYSVNSFEVAEFSSRGPILGNYKPDLIVSGVNVVSACNFKINKKFYDVMSGTSVSAPIVAGVVSRLIKKYPNHTPDQIKSILINNCVKIVGDRNSEGYGWLNLSKVFN
ncbi:MAG: S8 family serine peptidase, partial [Clostridia bacterium]|nr:S8 family serine peptidase [Clostridia bacterium]